MRVEAEKKPQEKPKVYKKEIQEAFYFCNKLL